MEEQNRESTYGHGVRGGDGEKYGVTWKLTLPYVQ